MSITSSCKVWLLALAVVVVACDGGGSARTAGGGGNVDPGGDGGPNQQPGDGGGAEDARAERDGSEEIDAAPGCKSACAADDCGAVPDGCGEFLACSECGQGLVCGQNAPNKCGAPPPVACTPLSSAAVCAGKCGAVSDGCSSVVLCNAVNGGVSCGNDQTCTNSVCVTNVSPCVARTCADKMHECGEDGDGCGGTINCGECGPGQQCDFAEQGNTCIDIPPPACTKRTVAEACTSACGIVSDGCGGTYDCEDSPFACAAGLTCGGGGVPNQCGSGQTACEPASAEEVCPGKCGTQSDGCGNAITCSASNGGQTCNALIGESCGGGGVPNQCGKPACIPKTFAELCPGSGGNDSCGKQPDGCGSLVDCGNCDAGQQCGLAGPSLCGTIPVCQPTPAATACAGKCGAVPDGCGGSYVCNASNGGAVCTGDQYCGANNMPNRCGTPPVSCVPRTCEQLGHTCGLASDGCGKVLNCWPSCPSNDPTCSGSCSSSAACITNPTTNAQSCVQGGPACTGSLCSSVPNSCPAASPSRLTGRVVTPGRKIGSTTYNRLPVPNAIVYIPADPSVALPAIQQGVVTGSAASCGRCDDEKLVADGQTVLAAAVTNYQGNFTLEGRIPVGRAFNLVIKIGKWRRVVPIAADVAVACGTNALDLESTRLNASMGDGASGTWLPKIAVSTGDADAMECVLLGIGISQSEFVLPSQAATGRVHMYRANGARMPGATCSGSYGSWNTSCAANNNAGCIANQPGCSWSNQDSVLFGSQAALNAYDLTVLDCEGAETNADKRTSRTASANARSYLLSYANNGGRLFASHWSYEWLDGNGALDQAASWQSQGADNTATGYISMPSGPTQRPRANPTKSPLYRNWLDNQALLSGTAPRTELADMRDPRDVAGQTSGPSTDEWMYRVRDNAEWVQQLSFNTPYGATSDAICGRVAFSSFHVVGSSGTRSQIWPSECGTSELNAQEKTLAFMLFDLATCVSAGEPPQPPACEPKTGADVCAGANDACGFVPDGCGGVVDCQGCAAGYYCDGNTCRPQECTPSTCASLGYTCGSYPDGCGGIARNSAGQEGCGTCSGGQTCGFGSTGLCGGCVRIPLATACPEGSCGTVSDGCGGTYDCGTCTSPAVCGGGGENRCGPGTCTPITQPIACANKNCGVAADGCGGSYTCGSCTQPGDTCGGGGAPNVCGQPICTPRTRAQACEGLSCGFVSDGCGGAINCGSCPNGGVCGGAGPNQCGASCTPTTCSAAGANCGTIADRCGGLLSCGSCPTGQVCGATDPNQCGPGNSCTPLTCAEAGAQCGLVGDGCGGALDCGACPSPLTCGGAGTSNQCGNGQGGCNKLTCSGQNVSCGQASDGCGGLLDCGGCPSGSYCEAGVCNLTPI